ncbi:MAG: hypothetical protein OEY33_00320 [Bdellovibrionales bacterium]|jgi:hypothetical protein|nr:hypothetical protein [Bdellovibrionales bacterium]
MKSKYKTVKTPLTRSEKNTFSIRTSLRPKRSIKGSKSLRSAVISQTLIRSEIVKK